MDLDSFIQMKPLCKDPTLKMRAIGAPIALLIGSLLTGVSAIAAYVTDLLHVPALSSFLFWPNTMLQYLEPCISRHTGTENYDELVAVLLDFLSYPASIIAYTVGVLIFSRVRMVGSVYDRRQELS